MLISIGCDHAGYPYKGIILELLKEMGHETADFGTHSPDSVDYPDFAHPTANLVNEGLAEKGILLCGSGNGVSMTANKYPKVRAALCWARDLAEMARLHNDANILCIPVRYVSEETALSMVRAFIRTDFEGGRHQRRVGKI